MAAAAALAHSSGGVKGGCTRGMPASAAVGDAPPAPSAAGATADDAADAGKMVVVRPVVLEAPPAAMAAAHPTAGVKVA